LYTHFTNTLSVDFPDESKTMSNPKDRKCQSETETETETTVDWPMQPEPGQVVMTCLQCCDLFVDSDAVMSAAVVSHKSQRAAGSWTITGCSTCYAWSHAQCSEAASMSVRNLADVSTSAFQ